MSPERILTSKASRAVDLKARKRFGVDTLMLMENAGASVAFEAIRFLKGKKKVAIFCGKGNNGGDGFVAARHLLACGVRPDVFLAGSKKDAAGEAKYNLAILLNCGFNVNEFAQEIPAWVEAKIKSYDLIIDALLGVGLSGPARGACKKTIELINSSGVFIISVDIPSGLDATTGRVLGSCIKAGMTVTFVAKKKGMLINDGPGHCGKIIVKHLGIPL